MVIFAVVFWYSLVVLIRNAEKLIGKCPGMEDSDELPEYTIMIKYHLGKWGEVIAIAVALIYGVVINIVNFILIVQDNCL